MVKTPTALFRTDDCFLRGYSHSFMLKSLISKLSSWYVFTKLRFIKDKATIA